MKIEYSDIITAIESVRKKEIAYCNEYIKLNPDDVENRKRMLNSILYGAESVLHEINAMYMKK